MSRDLPSDTPGPMFPASAFRQIVQTLGGLACSGLILVMLALLRTSRDAGPATETYSARLVTVPLDEPPPPPREQTPPEPGPIVGPMHLEIAPETASAVRIQVPPVPLAATETPPPPARAVVAARFSLGDSVKHPVRADDDRPTRRIFSREEVDQRPLVVYRVKPKFSDKKVSQMATPRVGLLLVVNTDGSVSDVRVMRSSGETDFDQTIVDTIGEWRFRPAVRRGHKVRCWVEQMISVKVSGASPFEAH